MIGILKEMSYSYKPIREHKKIMFAAILGESVKCVSSISDSEYENLL